jgi:hypothetical protein
MISDSEHSRIKICLQTHTIENEMYSNDDGEL